MKTVNIHEAKTHLSRLVNELKAGEEIIRSGNRAISLAFKRGRFLRPEVKSEKRNYQDRQQQPSYVAICSAGPGADARPVLGSKLRLTLLCPAGRR